jgi:hypothetical protein
MEKLENEVDDYYKSDDFNFFKYKKTDTFQIKENEDKLNTNKKISELPDKNINNHLKNSNTQKGEIFTGNKISYVKSIKDSNLAIYQEPIPTYDGYFSKSN